MIGVLGDVDSENVANKVEIMNEIIKMIFIFITTEHEKTKRNENEICWNDFEKIWTMINWLLKTINLKPIYNE